METTPNKQLLRLGDTRERDEDRTNALDRTTILPKATLVKPRLLKPKAAAGLGVASLLASACGSLALAATGGGEQLTAQGIIGKCRDAYAALSSYTDTGTV